MGVPVEDDNDGSASVVTERPEIATEGRQVDRWCRLPDLGPNDGRPGLSVVVAHCSDGTRTLILDFQ